MSAIASSSKGQSARTPCRCASAPDPFAQRSASGSGGGAGARGTAHRPRRARPSRFMSRTRPCSLPRNRPARVSGFRARVRRPGGRASRADQLDPATATDRDGPRPTASAEVSPPQEALWSSTTPDSRLLDPPPLPSRLPGSARRLARRCPPVRSSPATPTGSRLDPMPGACDDTFPSGAHRGLKAVVVPRIRKAERRQVLRELLRRYSRSSMTCLRRVDVSCAPWRR
jgi:hypothetical protein